MVLGAPGVERAVGVEGCSTVLDVSGAGGAEGLGATARAASSPAAQPSSVLTYTTAI